MKPKLIPAGDLSEPNDLKYLEWAIPKFSYYSCHRPQKFIISPRFVFDDISWHISLRPYDDLSLFLINECDCPLNINFLFGIKGSDGSFITYASKNSTFKSKSGFTNFYDASCIQYNDTLTIVCILTLGVNRDRAFNCNGNERNGTSNEIVGELSEPNNLRQIEWVIPKFSYLSNSTYPRYFIISPTFVHENTTWHISFSPCDTDPSVFLINETKQPRSVNFSFSIKSSNGMLFVYRANNTTIKYKSGFTNFYDVGVLNANCFALLPSDTLTIDLCIINLEENEEETFSYADNYTTSEANNQNLESEVKNLKLVKLTETDVLCKNLKDLLINKDFCDTTLRVNDKEFSVHKTILVARSSVFADMFENYIPLKATYSVSILDCDSNTFPQFLEYLYTGRLEGVTFNSAFQLYNTSDKFKVQELKMFCTKFMVENLNIQNICDVIVLADKYGDVTLCKNAEEFFCKNFDAVVKTIEWRGFYKMNPRLASDLLSLKNDK